MVTVPDLPEYPQYLSFTQAFTYDGANRLATASEGSNWSRAFGYDQYGNMWIKGSSGINPLGNAPQSQSSFNANNQITTGGASFDAAGNQTVVNGDTLAYDAENRMTSAYDPVMHSTETYIYDGNGQRVQKSGPGGTTTYVYDAFGNLAAEYGAAPSAPCTTCYLSYDHLGSVRLVTDQNGNVVSRHDYLPFGEEIPATAGRNAQWGSTTDSEQKFTGQIRDTETQMDYFNARYFTNALGRFNSPDPENAGADPADPQTWNAYAYVRNNPLALVDPLGLCQLDDNGNGVDDADGTCYYDNSPTSTTVTASEPPDVPVIVVRIYWPSDGGPEQEQPTEIPPTTRESPAKEISELPGILKTKIGQVQQTCLAAFDTNRRALSTTGRRIKFYNGVSDRGNLYMFYKPKKWATPAYDFQTVDANPLHTAIATTLFGPNGLPSPNVVVWRNFWTETRAGQAQTLWHELTHVFTKQGDLGLDRRFNINTEPFGGDAFGASGAYDNWLQNGCH